MRRSLELLAIGLVLAGLELAVGAFSRAFGQIVETIRFASDGESPPLEFWVGLPMFLAGIGLGVVVAWARWNGATIRPVEQCPQCGAETQRLKRRRRHRLLGRVLGTRLSRRRCGDCGWTGLSVKH